MASIGWIKLSRQICDSDIWDNDEPFDRRSAWIDLLLMANIKDKKLVYRGRSYLVKRGEVWTSKNKLASRWHWDRRKVDRFLQLLEDLEMISCEVRNINTSIFIRNYATFQDLKNEKCATRGTSHGTSDGATNGTTDGTSDSTLLKKDKKDKKDKEDKNNFVCDIADDEWIPPEELMRRYKDGTL